VSKIRAGKRGGEATVNRLYNHAPKKSTENNNDHETCRVCGQSEYLLLEEGPHIAKRCRNCGKWARWVPHTPENLAACETPPAPKAPTLFAVPDPKPAVAGTTVAPCDHRAELDRLIQHLRGIESHLSIVTRALMGQAR